MLRREPARPGHDAHQSRPSIRRRRAQQRKSTTRPLTSHADDIRNPPARRKATPEGLGLRRMADLPTVTPDYFEILVVRELRKVGFDVGAVRIHRRAELPEPEHGFVLELLALLGRPPWTRQALIACRRQEAPIARDVVDSLKGRLKDAAAEVALVFSTVEFAPDALTAGREAGVALLRVVDGHSVFDASGWGPSGHYPACCRRIWRR